MGRQQRQQDYLDVFGESINYAIDNEANAVLHNGNLFWSQSPDDQVLIRCRKHLERANQADVNFCLVLGERDENNREILSELEEDGLLTILDPRWNEIGDIAVFVNDNTMVDPESGYHYPPEDVSVKIAALAGDIKSTTGYSDVRAYESAVGWSLDAILLGDQQRPVQRVEDGVQILSSGPPERVVGKALIDEDSDWNPQVSVYDFTSDNVSITSHETDARPVAGFRLNLNEADTLDNVREVLEDTELKETAAIFEITGTKTEDSPTKSEIEAVVDESAAITRGYDERTFTETAKDKSRIRDTPERGENRDPGDETESRSESGGHGGKNSADLDEEEAGIRVVAFGHIGDDGSILDRIAEETASQRVDAYVYTGGDRSVSQRTDARTRSETVRQALGRLADQAPVYVVPDDDLLVWDADTDEYAPPEPPTIQTGTEAWPTGVRAIPFDDRVAVGDCFLTRNPLLGSEDTLLVTHHARPEQWHGGQAGYVAGGHFVGRHDRTYLNVGFTSFDPGVGRDPLYGQYFSFTVKEGKLQNITWNSLGMVERRTCPDHQNYGTLYLLEGLQCPFCAMETRCESSSGSSVEGPSTVYERSYLVASDDLPARQAHQVAYFTRYGVLPPAKTTKSEFPVAMDDGQTELDELALENQDLRGELMYFLDSSTADEIWREICDLVAQGDLYDARLSTAFTRTARGDSQHLLLVTVPNYTALHDVHRVHRKLTAELNLEDPVSLKPTLYTELGIYTSNASEWELSRSTRYTVQAKESPKKESGLSETPAIATNSYPADLVEINQWLLWKPEPDGRKIPRAPWETGDDTFVSAMDDQNQTSFETAKEKLAELQDTDYGLAFTITEDDPFVLLDYDNARDPETGEIPALVRQHIADADSYADVSTSGTGVHILVRGSLAEDITAVVADLPEHEFSIEVYDSDRFVVMTGDRISGTQVETTPSQGLLDRLQSEHATRKSYDHQQTNEEPIKSRAELDNLDETDDIDDIFDSIKQVRPRDISLKSTVTKERSDGSKSLDPSWTVSESGTRLGQLDDVWIYRKGMYALDALQVVALEERLITQPDEYPTGEVFWEAVEELRKRGANIPKYSPSST